MSDRRVTRAVTPGVAQHLSPLAGDRPILPDNIGLHIRLVQLAVLREFQRVFHGSGLTASVHAMMMIIGQNPGIRQGALADALLVCSPNVAAAIANLDQAGLVARTVDEQDRRALCVRLTPQGEQLLVEAQERLDGFELRLLGAFSGREQDQLRRYLRRILDSLA